MTLRRPGAWTDCHAGLVTYAPGRLLVLLVGCVVLGAGVALFLTADLGSDGYSTLVNGIALATGLAFWVANLLVGVTLVALAAVRRVFPGVGTVVQVVVVGVTVSLLVDVLDEVLLGVLVVVERLAVVAGAAEVRSTDTGTVECAVS